MTEIISNIPTRIKNASVGGHVCGTDDIIDDSKNKTQKEINNEVEESLCAGGSVDTRIAEEGAKHYLKEETYNKDELDSMITTPNPDYISVSTYAELIALEEHPNGAIYRVANYDGVSVDTTKFAEYTWTGSEYKLMAVRGNTLEPLVGYVTCTTAEGVQNKEVTIPNYFLTIGGSIKIKMSNKTSHPSTKLKINSLTPIPLFYNGVQADASNTWNKDGVIEVYYDGTQFQGAPITIDDEPTSGSNNLVKSGGIDYNIKKLSNKNIEPVLGYYIKKNGTVASSYNHIKTIVKAGDIVVFSGNNSNSSYCYTAALIPDDGGDTVVIVETGAASNFVYKVTTDGTLYVNFSMPYLATSYLKFINPEYELINELYAENGNVTYDDDGNILSYPVKWSSGATGTYTNTDWDAANNMYKGYEITYSTLMKLVQPAVTVSNGKITNIPIKTIIEL